jgi:large subunit ribosomal protein L22
MAGTKTNERPGTRAQVRHVRMSASKAREVLDLVRGLPVEEALGVLQFTERGASDVASRCLSAAIANAQHNDELDPDTLYVATCYADEGPTLKRWRPRARGRATRIRKRMCHITIIVAPMSAEMAARVEAKRAAAGGGAAPSRRSRRGQESRRARVARSRGETVTPEETEVDETEVTTGEPTEEMVEEAEEAAAEETEAGSETDTIEETNEASTDEALTEDESSDERGVDSAEGGDAEGGASTKAKNIADESADDESTDDESGEEE